MELISLSNQDKDHFKGKDVLEHLIDARKRGHTAGHEPHGIEPSGMLNGLIDSAKEAALLLTILSFCFFSGIFYSPISLLILCSFSFGFAIWKFGRSTFLAWSRLEKLHRVTIEEKKEIEENRETERQELAEIYRLKGFEGKLLDDVINILMQDDNRLLQIMLEEEIGISLYCQEHPLKQGFGAFLGAILASFVILINLSFFSWIGALITGALIVFFCQLALARLEKNRLIPAVVWGIGIFAISFGASYFLIQIFRGI